MRILVSVENDDQLDNLKNKVCALVSSLKSKEVFIDILHVHEEVNFRHKGGKDEVVDEILQNEYKSKLNLVAKCEDLIESYLRDKLQLNTLVNSYVLKGDYQERLKDHIIFQRYDLLVLNPSKKSNYEVILQGRNTHWIIDNLEIPVLILPSYLDYQFIGSSDLTCFVDSNDSYQSVRNSQVISLFKPEIIQYIFFGEKSFSEDVTCIHSSDPLASISEYTTDDEHLNIYTLHHKNKGDFLNYIDRSFTKHIIKSLANPLLIF